VRDTNRTLDVKFWPVPESYSRKLPEYGAPGSFWENREDRHHCGVDIYAPKGSKVRAVEAGEIIEVGRFTSPELLSYWNVTYYILLQLRNDLVSNYAELGEVLVKAGQRVKAGQVIALVGSVLNLDKITEGSPPYIQRLRQNGNQSMLHFELYEKRPTSSENYVGGNYFRESKPDGLLDAASYLRDSSLRDS
jgi:murein DD-endopeptidase MepM/ murein hydrolase activator NlpD